MSKIVFSILILFFFLSVSIYADRTGENDVTHDDSIKTPSKYGTSKLQPSRRKAEIDNAEIINSDSLLEFHFKFQYQQPRITIGTSFHMPIIHTCDGDDVSPGMNIRTKKENLTSFALICDDPDAPVGDWVHWVIYNIPPGKDLPENIKKTIRPDLGYPLDLLQPIQGINDFGKIGYGGPCPPIGQEHRYFFKLYALDTVLKFNEADIQKGITKDMLLKAMDGHIFAEWYKIGKYKR